MAAYKLKVPEFHSHSVYKSGGLGWSSVHTRMPKMWALVAVKEWTASGHRNKLVKKKLLFPMSFIQASNRRCGPD